MPPPTIRPALASDAEAVAGLVAELHAHLAALGDPFPFHFDAEAYRRDGFGPRPAFEGLVADVEGELVGYLLHHDAYDTDASRRLLFVIDLYVRPSLRGHGVGRALMTAAADAARARGATSLVWTVLTSNREAAAFFDRLGATRNPGLAFRSLPVSQTGSDPV